MRKIFEHHIEGWTRESHPRVQDWQHLQLSKPSRELQILDTQMGFPRPSFNMVLDSINPHLLRVIFGQNAISIELLQDILQLLGGI